MIDFGTAITFDCLTEKCEYLGGAILPGIAISLEALANKTANLPHIDISEAPPSIIGKSTVQAMKSGILYGYGGMIDGLVQGIKDEMLTTAGRRIQGCRHRWHGTFDSSLCDFNRFNRTNVDSARVADHI